MESVLAFKVTFSTKYTIIVPKYAATEGYFIINVTITILKTKMDAAPLVKSKITIFVVEEIRRIVLFARSL